MAEMNPMINRLRSKMIAVAEKHGMNLLHPEVIYWSQQLDVLIVESMQMPKTA
ncbi:aspartyl-phosphate phosphatase Spo0E family protein [Paenibacillus xanthanilyticus]|uniref:Aspartyl-phosphate phosphatase Spo0E family protein n=1 Tax=Paenibacillus xanthanilyticus TaxID=1783531 RepID=A0ABV8K7B6_9BACL